MKHLRPSFFFSLVVAALLDAGWHVHGQADDEAENPFAAHPEAFPKIEVAVDDHGKPVSQVVRLNGEVVTREDGRYSGFRFKVDRTQAAEKQKVGDKTSMPFVWFFILPEKMKSWYIVPVEGSMEGFNNFCPLKLTKFKNTADFFPTQKSIVVLQQLPADRLVEGREYIMWFKYPTDVTEADSVTVGLGYAPTLRNFDDKGISGLIDSVGLDLGGQHPSQKRCFCVAGVGPAQRTNQPNKFL